MDINLLILKKETASLSESSKFGKFVTSNQKVGIKFNLPFMVKW